MSEDWSSPGLHHSMKKCDAGELHGSTHMQTFECGNDTGSDCRRPDNKRQEQKVARLGKIAVAGALL